MGQNLPLHIPFLESAAQEILRGRRSEQFIEWVSRYLVSVVKPSHVSIALYDPQRDTFPVRHSVGRQRFPPRLVALVPHSPIAKWFLQRERFPPQGASFLSHSVISQSQDLKGRPDPLSRSVLEEMGRHRAEVCGKIETQDRLAGYLLIGEKEDTKPYSREEIAFFETLTNDIAIEIEKEEYYRLSHFDPLTKLLSRTFLLAQFESLICKAEKAKEGIGVALIDVDDFKKINDTLGHQVGDQVLCIVSEIIRRRIRKSDLAFRYGGEEFLILLGRSSREPQGGPFSTLDFQKGIYQVLERLRQEISGRPFLFPGHTVQVTVSIGLSFSTPGKSETSRDLTEQADQALYASKRRGKNLITLYPKKP